MTSYFMNNKNLLMTSILKVILTGLKNGINDEVRVEGAGIIELQFMIFNRWGEKVFESNDQQKGWNGIYKGQMQEMDAYAYTVKARFLDNTRKVLTGNITLLK